MAIIVSQEGGPIPGIGTVFRLSNYAYMAGQIGVCSVAFKLDVAVGAGGDFMGDVCLAMYNLYATQWKGALSDSAVSIGAKLSQLSPGVKPLPGIVTDGGAGTAGAGALPQQVSGIVKTNTTRSGNAFRGRFYVPFPYAASIDADFTPLAAYVTKINNLAANWVTGMNVTPTATVYQFIPVIWHLKANKKGTTAANTFDPITGFLSEKAWATQRRRGDFGRINANAIH